MENQLNFPYDFIESVIIPAEDISTRVKALGENHHQRLQEFRKGPAAGSAARQRCFFDRPDARDQAADHHGLHVDLFLQQIRVQRLRTH